MMDALFARYPPSGQLVSVNSHRLHLYTLGDSSPTVLFESGQLGFSLDWMWVQPQVARFTRAVAYDRAGLGWSDAGPRPRTPQRIVAELHTLLSHARVPLPLVLVAYSLGWRYALRYAQQYPAEVAGLVAVDAFDAAFDQALDAQRFATLMRARALQYRGLNLLARLGVVRQFSPQLLGLLGPEFRRIPASERRRYATVAARPQAVETTIEEYEHAVAADAGEEPPPGRLPTALPLRVLSHGIPWRYAEYERAWQHAQVAITTLSATSERRMAERSGHPILLGQPELVVAAIEEVVGLVRAEAT
jgi:pimeloyl-ACP methyl ester carboxylesterase